MRFAMLGSGSKGNGTLVDAGGVRVLVDCGFAVREVEARAARLDFDLHSLDAILVTHEHGDHLGGVARLARAYDLPVYLTRGSYQGWRDKEVEDIRFITPHEPFHIGALTVRPFPVPHDAKEPCQFAFEHAGKKLGVVSDLGAITQHIRYVLSDCDALLLEANHDPVMLANGPYPQKLKDRVGGGLGHLSNKQSASLVSSVQRARLQHLVLTHLSEQNNTPELARTAICDALEQDPAWCVCAHQQDGLAWREIA
ncbi:MAG: MBL fold metallo-hydrolase [Pseudomonadota bacterium]